MLRRPQSGQYQGDLQRFGQLMDDVEEWVFGPQPDGTRVQRWSATIPMLGAEGPTRPGGGPAADGLRGPPAQRPAGFSWRVQRTSVL